MTAQMIAVPQTRRPMRPPADGRLREVVGVGTDAGGRRVVAAVATVALVVVLAIPALDLLPTAASGPAPVEASGELVVVGPGDTFWSLAAEHLPTVERPRAITALEELNGPAASLRVGDVVALPEI